MECLFQELSKNNLQFRKYVGLEVARKEQFQFGMFISRSEQIILAFLILLRKSEQTQICWGAGNIEGVWIWKSQEGKKFQL